MKPRPREVWIHHGKGIHFTEDGTWTVCGKRVHGHLWAKAQGATVTQGPTCVRCRNEWWKYRAKAPGAPLTPAQPAAQGQLFSSAYGGHPPHVKGSDTSAAAAVSIRVPAGTLRFKVFAYLKKRGAAGSTDEELEHALELRHQTASARRRELVLDGLVEDSGERRKTSSGRQAVVWKAVAR